LQLDWPDVLLATVDREGRFRLRRVTGKGYVPLREARMRLDDLWAGGGKPQVPLVDTKASESLPAILNVVPFPLLLPHHLMSERMWSGGWLGVLALTRDKRLMMWNGREHAGRQLSQEMPSGNLLWCSPAPIKERSSAIVGAAGGRELCLIHVHLSREECERIPFRVASPTFRAATVHGDTIFLIGKRRIILRHLEDGEAFDTWQLPPEFSWRCGRFLQGANRDWWMLNSGAESGERLRHVTLGTDTSNAMGRRFVEFAELPREEGPVGITTDGDLFFFRDNRMLWLSKGHYLLPPVRLLATARDGTRLILGSTYKRSQRVARITLETGACEMLHGYPPALANQHLLDNLRSCSLRHRFQAIGVTGSEIHLRGRKGDRRCIRLHDERGSLELGPSDKGDIDVRFELLTVPNVGFRLSVARWPDGSRIFLDSRGMLHLKSSDRAIPEVSIVLCEGALSGWCSDGRLWGRKYFIGDTPPALDGDVYHSSIRPFLQRLPSPCPR
jgi:hypothetical protein